MTIDPPTEKPRRIRVRVRSAEVPNLAVRYGKGTRCWCCRRNSRGQMLCSICRGTEKKTTGRKTRRSHV